MDTSGMMIFRKFLTAALVLLMLTSFQNVSGSSSASTPIQHIIIIMQENHSFDNYFGTYPTANGTLLDSTTARLRPVNGLPNNVCLPYRGSCVSPRLDTSSSPSNPIEGQTTYEMDYANNGTGFATYSGPQSLVYFDYHLMAGYWDYAEEYGLGDNYFAPVLSTTTPNRLMMLTGDTPVSANYGPPPTISYSKTVFGQLDAVGLSWGYYDYLNSFGRTSNVYPLNYTTGIPEQELTNVRNMPDLFSKLTSGIDLPSVSFVNFLGIPQLTEHPSFNPTVGEQSVVSIVNHIMESSYWPTTAIFITWDEGGGFYDHVVPPKDFVIDHGFPQELVGLGQRVPLLVISPYAKENFVSRTLLSHLSLLHFIEYNWHLTPLNRLVAGSNLPLNFFDFSQAPRSPILISSPIVYPIPLQPQQNVSLNSPVQYSGLAILLTIPAILVLFFSLRRFSASRNTRAPPKAPQ